MTAMTATCRTMISDFEIAVADDCPVCSCPWQGEPTRSTERCSSSICICHADYAMGRDDEGLLYISTAGGDALRGVLDG